MAVTQPLLARAMARTFAEAIRDEGVACRLWVWSDHGYIEPGRDYVELWLLADPADQQAEHRLRLAAADLHRQYPDTNIRVHLITPRMLAGHDPREAIRSQAEEIDLAGE